MMHAVRIGFFWLLLVAAGSSAGLAQESSPDTTDAWHEDAWTEIVTQRGLAVSYIYYPEADTEHNGVVLRLENEGDRALRYVFTLIFRSPDVDTSTVVRGTIGAGEMVTGASAGLFWVPFRREGREVAEIGMRGLEVTPVPN